MAQYVIRILLWFHSPQPLPLKHLLGLSTSNDFLFTQQSFKITKNKKQQYASSRRGQGILVSFHFSVLFFVGLVSSDLSIIAPHVTWSRSKERNKKQKMVNYYDNLFLSTLKKEFLPSAGWQRLKIINKSMKAQHICFFVVRIEASVLFCFVFSCWFHKVRSWRSVPREAS